MENNNKIEEKNILKNIAIQQDVLPISRFLYCQKKEGTNKIKIFYGLEQICEVDISDKMAVYINAVTMAENGLRKNDIAKVFEMDRGWLRMLIQIKKEKGWEGIFAIQRGAQVKVTEEIKIYAKERLNYYFEKKEIKGHQVKMLEDIKKEFNIEMSGERLRQIICEERKKMKAELKKKREQEITESIKTGNETPKKENYNRYAGLLLLSQYIEVSGIISRIQKNITEKCEEIQRIIIVILYLFFLSKTKIEKYKEVKREELSSIIELRKIMTPESIRSILREKITFEDMMKVNKEQMKEYLERNEEKEYWLFIDGHVLRYKGRKKTLKTFHQQSHCAVKGRVQYYLHTSDGLPLYFETNDGYNDFREIINKIVEELKTQTGEGYKKYLYIFDRGGFSYEELGHLKNEKKISFAVWMKNERSKFETMDLQYTEIKIELKHNKIDVPRIKTIEAAIAEEKFKLFNPNNKNEYIELKKIVIRNGRKYTAFLTNDTERTIEELVKAMTLRWREETDFGRAVLKRGLNDINEYGGEPFSEEVIKKFGYESCGTKYIETPEYKELNEKRKILKNDIEHKLLKLGRKTNSIKNLEKIYKNEIIETIKKDIDKLKNEKHKILMEMDTSKKEIKKIEVLIQQGIYRLEYKQKFFMDILRVAAAHIENDFMRDMVQFYKNRRDIFNFLYRVIETGGYVQNNDSEITVIFSKLNTPRENKALENFINFINTQGASRQLITNQKISFKLEA